MGKAMQDFLNESSGYLSDVYECNKAREKAEARVNKLEEEVEDLKARIVELEGMREEEKGNYKRDVLAKLMGLLDK